MTSPDHMHKCVIVFIHFMHVALGYAGVQQSVNGRVETFVKCFSRGRRRRKKGPVD